MTFSVVMRDSETAELGVAVQSHWFNVGRIVPWARAGVGVAVSRALADPMYGPLSLDLMASGVSADEALATLVGRDPERAVRQVAMVDHRGRVAVHTGSRCIGHSGHASGDGWSVQANIMRSAGVIPATASAAQSTDARTRVIPPRSLSLPERYHAPAPGTIARSSRGAQRTSLSWWP